MMIKCNAHGFYNALQVSPDIKKQVEFSVGHLNIIIIDFEYDGDVVDSFYLSEGFAQKNGYKCNQKMTLPDDYPRWVGEMVLVCEKCFQEFSNL